MHKSNWENSSKNKGNQQSIETSRHTIERIIKKGFVPKNKRGFILKTCFKLSEVDVFWDNLISQTILGFYCEKLPATLDSLHAKLIKISKARL